MMRAIIYYSLSENTKEAAEYLAKKLNADLYRIELTKPMPDKMWKQMLIGGMQSSFGMTPKIKGEPENVDVYDEIIIGTPIWAGKAASPINSLLKNASIADKVVAVFTFSGGGDNEKCISYLAKKIINMRRNVALADRTNGASGNNYHKLDEFVEGI